MSGRATPLIAGPAIGAFHDAGLVAFFERDAILPAPETTALWTALADNHRNNMQLWAEEDLARRKHVPDSEIAANKRAIDRYNQARNDAIERMDEVLETLIPHPGDEGARLNSETPGSIVDRLSIASLKMYHMRLQTVRDDAEPAHRVECAARLERLGRQRSDLARCLDELLAECGRGLARFMIYRQFKMYNDPRLNMALVQESRQGLPLRSSLSTALR